LLVDWLVDDYGLYPTIMPSEPWRISTTREYDEQIRMLPQTEQEKIGSKVSELFQRPHPSEPEQIEERLSHHFPGVQPARAIFADIGYELTYEQEA
jgi:hypothetical protein